MNVQKFLENKTFSELETKLGIKVKRYTEDNLVVLNYDQVNSPKNDPIIKECRGLILDGQGNVISRSLDRFFNEDENGSIQDIKGFDFTDCIIQEKADGSLVKIYYFPGKNRWEISTRGTAFAEGKFSLGGTYREHILSAMNSTEEEFQKKCEKLNKNLTYIFEYVGPENQIVTKYGKSEMIYITSRENTFPFSEIKEIDHSLFNSRDPVTYKVKSKRELKELLLTLPTGSEGFVIYHIPTGVRRKVKTETYILMHHMRIGKSEKSFAELVCKGEIEEYLSYFPDDRKIAQKYIDNFEKLKFTLKEEYEKLRNLTNKEMGLILKDSSNASIYSSIYFKAKKSGTEVMEAFSELSLEKQASYILN